MKTEFISGNTETLATQENSPIWMDTVMECSSSSDDRQKYEFAARIAAKIATGVKPTSDLSIWPSQEVAPRVLLLCDFNYVQRTKKCIAERGATNVEVLPVGEESDITGTIREALSNVGNGNLVVITNTEDASLIYNEYLEQDTSEDIAMLLKANPNLAIIRIVPSCGRTPTWVPYAWFWGSKENDFSLRVIRNYPWEWIEEQN